MTDCGLYGETWYGNWPSGFFRVTTTEVPSTTAEPGSM